MKQLLLLQLMARYQEQKFLNLQSLPHLLRIEKNNSNFSEKKMAFQFHRYMRTPHSEIYGIFSSDQVEKGPVGRVDIHYSLYGLVNGLVVMEQDLSETETEELIAKIDDELVEMTTIDDENFEITVAFATKVLTFGKEENDEE